MQALELSGQDFPEIRVIEGRHVQVILKLGDTLDIFETLDVLWAQQMAEPIKPSPHPHEAFTTTDSAASVYSSGVDDYPLTETSTDTTDSMASSDSTDTEETTTTGLYREGCTSHGGCMCACVKESGKIPLSVVPFF